MPPPARGGTAGSVLSLARRSFRQFSKGCNSVHDAWNPISATCWPSTSANRISSSIKRSASVSTTSLRLNRWVHSCCSNAVRGEEVVTGQASGREISPMVSMLSFVSTALGKAATGLHSPGLSSD